MKKFKLILMILSISIILSSCQLAKEKDSKNPMNDRLVGGIVTYTDIDNDGTFIDAEKVKIEIFEKNGEKYTEVKGMEGHAFILIETELEDGIKEIEVAADKYLKTHLSEGRGKNIDNIYDIKAETYLNIEMDISMSLRLYPVYMNSKGEYYISEGTDYFSGTDYSDIDKEIYNALVKEGDTIEAGFGKEYKSNGKVERVSIEVMGERVYKGKEFKFIEMDKENKEVKVNEFASKDIPEVLIIDENTEYIIFEEYVNENTTKRRVFNLYEEQPFFIPIFIDEDIAEIKDIQFTK